MYSVRAARYVRQTPLWRTQRQAWVGNNLSRPALEGLRRREFTWGGPGKSIGGASSEEQRLEKFTSYALSAHSLPLGTMTSEEWDDLVAVADYWTTQAESSGFALDTAEKIVQRLTHENGVRHPNPSQFNYRSRTISEFRIRLLNSRVQMSDSHEGSNVALERTEQALLNLMDLHDFESNRFPKEKFAVLMEGWLQIQSLDSAEKAAQLLLKITSDQRRQNMIAHVPDLTNYFNKTMRLLRQREREAEMEMDEYAMSFHLLKRMDDLTESASWAGLVLADSTRDMLHGTCTVTPGVKVAGDSEKVPAAKEISSFEIDAMQQKLIRLLQTGDARYQQNIEKMIPRLQEITEPSEELWSHIVDYYLRVGNAELASRWLPRLKKEDILATVTSDGEQQNSILDRLLDAWMVQAHPRAPWRAEEIFRQVVDGTSEGSVPLSTMNRVLHVWSHSTDPAASRKVKHWFNKMIEEMDMVPDAMSLKLMLEATENNLGAIESIIALVEEKWNDFSQDERRSVGEAAVRALGTLHQLPLSVLSFLARCKEADIGLSRSSYLSTLQGVFAAAMDASQVLEIVDTVERRTKVADLVLYQAAIHALLRLDRKSTKGVVQLWTRALHAVGKNPTASEPHDVSEFVTSVVKMYTFGKNYADAEHFLKVAETTLLPSTPVEGEESVISLECYKRMIVRKWYTGKNSPKVIETSRRLLSHYESGFQNLLPDTETFAGFIKAQAAISEHPEDVEKVLGEILDLYQATGEDSVKPNGEIFNTVLSAYKQAGRDKEAGKKSLELWETMKQHDIRPETKTINFVMQNVVSGEMDGAYATAVDLYEQLRAFQLEPDSHTLHFLMGACGSARKEEQHDALKLCLHTLGEIRRRGEMGPWTYSIVTKALRHLLPPGYQADKVAASTLQLCYTDGLLDTQVKRAYQSMMSRGLWKRLYKDRLNGGKKEPSAWSRRIPDRRSRRTELA